MLSLVIVCGICISATQARPPSFQNDFAKHLTDGKANAQGNVERVYNLDIDPDDTLFTNIRKLFYPSVSGQ